MKVDFQEQMSAMARDLQTEASTEETLAHVVNAAVDIVDGCETASISLASRRGTIRTSAATSDAIKRADELQMELGEGPCIDAAWEHEVVSVPDLRVERRWPKWAPRTLDELGFRSMACLRLFTHTDLVGALNMFSHRSHAFTDADIQEGLAIAAHAAVAVADAEKIAGLEGALVSRTTIARATGLLMAYYGLTDTQAFDLLSRLSSEQNIKLATIARLVVEHHNQARERPGSLTFEE